MRKSLVFWRSVGGCLVRPGSLSVESCGGSEALLASATHSGHSQ